MNNAKEIKSHLIKNLSILAVSIALAFILAKSGLFGKILAFSPQLKIIGSFIAGMFFTSVLTVGPATVALAEIAQTNSIFLMALIGAAGSVIGDLVLFSFVRDRITDDFMAIFTKPKVKRLTHLLYLEIFRWLLPVLGVLIVASPLPDEIGLAIMGISKLKTRTFIIISYGANFLGILIVGLVARAVA